MARSRPTKNGMLEEAIRDLIQSQATLVRNQALYLEQKAEIDRRIAETQRINDERFARIEAILMEHSRILAEHTRMLQALPEAVREKIGFRAPPPAAPRPE